jgi:SAM-dependent methyltransferase
VVEIGCGSLGGFVPMLRSSGYEAVGVDPAAPDGEAYRRVEFEQAELSADADAVVASTSLHHVADLAEVLDRVAHTLVRAGTLVVIEWAWEEFDEPTAEWCFRRLGSDGEPGWLNRRREEWLASRQSWSTYFREWAVREQLHKADKIVRLLDERFDREQLSRGPYFFSDLGDTSAEEEQAAIEAGEIRATRVDYVGRLQ